TTRPTPGRLGAANSGQAWIRSWTPVACLQFSSSATKTRAANDRDRRSICEQGAAWAGIEHSGEVECGHSAKRLEVKIELGEHIGEPSSANHVEAGARQARTGRRPVPRAEQQPRAAYSH